jgi:hypothetical protein
MNRKLVINSRRLSNNEGVRSNAPLQRSGYTERKAPFDIVGQGKTEQTKKVPIIKTLRFSHLTVKTND